MSKYENTMGEKRGKKGGRAVGWGLNFSTLLCLVCYTK